jgi:hypothetical protein
VPGLGAEPDGLTSAQARRIVADGVVVSVTKVATGPMTAEEAAGIARFGDLTGYAPAIQKLAAS